jgi:hypothetical protein
MHSRCRSVSSVFRSCSDAILQPAREGRRIELPKVTAVGALRGSRPG